MPKSRSFWCALSATALLLTGACMSDEGKNAPLPRMSKEEATTRAEEYASRMAEAAGVSLREGDAETYFYDCVGKNDEIAGDGRFSLYHAVHADLPKEEHTAAVRKLRADFKEKGYEVTGYREYEDDYRTATVSATIPDDRFTVDVSSSGPSRKPSKTLLFGVRTPCLLPPGATQETQ
ncbi:hypothetical protein ACFW9F_16860 [Streptomyces sp. NPDC059506]